MNDLDWDAVGRSDVFAEEVTDESGKAVALAGIDIDLLKFERDDDGELVITDGEVGLDDMRTVVTVRAWLDEQQELDVEILYHEDDAEWLDNNEDIQGEIQGAIQDLTQYFLGEAT
ncbi:hypothetical protein [Alicyclobacillus acidoterrestris]|uniref:Uncharacterized protein n=1 Tax=Alicyclobacillus acidoterrestris (strain ATCC 49025 / DSM 3922 / CIP 106132 / NCIMB 13137 / GD3B) TaxID=1356854 RepID=T0C7I9_ALIAG|nr:hypothetical protein [Alicyclobacillus acidoterrestris]EPZ48934.1 hypothetical protein N007_03600 [Alicyclobacillus acidoterrestris ATCC 49025]UNO47466.1 hypothetical protein K1I37_12175 [Alicyclobacillus acidoterrestris]